MGSVASAQTARQGARGKVGAYQNVLRHLLLFLATENFAKKGGEEGPDWVHMGAHAPHTQAKSPLSINQ